ncbi:MAG: XRE family transcriptional regulator [Alphaproteobacteria bacterium BRH_c36]|nr:MAG: XRE family transcriptional regulator [Alphaproteobacteria bacterium BRH_c36]
MPIDPQVPNDYSQAIALKVREEIARRRITRQQLAVDARISLSTLEKALSGRRPFTIATLVRLEEALGLGLRGRTDTNGSAMAETITSLAPENLGSYSRPAVTWIEGAYLTLRPSFGDSSAVYAYRTEIAWDEGTSSLAFRETERLDHAFTQWGQVSIPHQSGHIYLVTNRHGQFRLVVVSRPLISGEMLGILTTLQAGRGAQLTPVSTPIALIPIKKAKKVHFGRIAAGHAAYNEYSAALRRAVDEPFALLLSPGRR